MTAPEAERLLTAEEVAAHLHVPLNTVRYWRQSGKGPAYRRIGKGIRYSRSDVDAWVAQQPDTPFTRTRTP